MVSGQQAQGFRFSQPGWVGDFAASYRRSDDIRARMLFVVKAAMHNVQKCSGGPFAAAVFDIEDHALIALGVNCVMREQVSMLHAEMVAITLAQRAQASYDLQGFELVTSCEPCAMCLGAITWAGLSRIVSGASDQDARDIGFDEGPKPADWVSELESRGIEVIAGLARTEAAGVLDAYLQQSSLIYNPKLRKSPS